MNEPSEHMSMLMAFLMLVILGGLFWTFGVGLYYLVHLALL